MGQASGQGRRVTITELAARCGVSKGTVSKALGLTSKHYEVSTALRDRIRQAAAEIGYAPDRLRQRRRGTPSRTVAMLFGGNAPITVGIESHFPFALGDALHEAGYMLVAIPTLDRGCEHWERIIRDIRPDGCLLLPPHQPGLAGYLAQAGCPAVILNGVSESGVVAITADDAGGAQLAVEHLLGLGHRRIAYLHAKPAAGHPSEDLRRSAVAEALARAGAPRMPDLRSTGQLAAALRDGRRRPTAIIAYDDVDAFTALAAARQAGLRLPDDLSIVGFNDSEATRLTSPALTVIDIPSRPMAIAAARQLLALMDGGKAASRTLAEHLIIRGSTTPPRATAHRRARRRTAED